ncbi:sulfate transporter CysZ [Legionella maioricensis]|uniref:Sulfate transporter CysZ n=1 Tax=Legionella maioricensis TaxID=2896528 RepID=A0A9X2D2B0_9GAMM|nr:sulfate transporter CysZ [Legionella maioricensis]MCL9685126.1 sulfate transporter CysZ [Legionella maioricensis]MCL9688361.1 sulfate transporter CysZ [Legionella maioricensis]
MLNFFKGVTYFVQGYKSLLTPGLKRFIIMPVAFNCLLFTGVFYLGYHYLMPYASHYVDKLPSWLSFLNNIVLVIFIMVFILLFLAMFTVMFNVIASPFNGLLAEKAQKLLYGDSIPPVPFTLMVIRSFKRQGKFLYYFVPRFLGMCLLFFIPFIQPVFPFIWFFFTAWMLSMQFQDLPLDNNLVSFYEMQQIVKANKMRSLGFGSLINLASFIPLLNIFIMPAAVIGSTMLYCDTHPRTKDT